MTSDDLDSAWRPFDLVTPAAVKNGTRVVSIRRPAAYANETRFGMKLQVESVLIFEYQGDAKTCRDRHESGDNMGWR